MGAGDRAAGGQGYVRDAWLKVFDRLDELTHRAAQTSNQIPNDRTPHSTIVMAELAVFDRLHAQLWRNRRGAAALPAQQMARLGRHDYLVCCGT